ncbi:phosphatase PAP2 family protein [Myxococcus sp. Y35]|uniref:phosphatase PAP2 family protein n=1 Tax=Pseudomyxococcus flavus TaxID=3115648 RepID=UPI003CF773E0
MSPRPALFAWPRLDELTRTGAMALGFACLFVAVYGGASWVTGYYPAGFRVELPFERHIPFIPAWALVYVSMDALLLLSLLILRTWRDMVPFALALSVETVVGALCFLVLPVEVAWPPRAVEGPWAGVFQFADTLNLERNYLPSLHVAFACTAALAYSERSGVLGRVVFGLWTLAIAASTLLIHEHQVVDVVAGALLAWVTWRKVAPWARRDSLLQALRVEALCARELFRFSRRHIRYGLIALVLYRYAVSRWWRQAHTARVGFCFFQLVDDVLDGDRAVDGEPLDWVDRLLVTLETGRVEDTGTAATLGRVLLERLGDTSARAEVLALVRTMRRDRERVKEGQWWSEDALRSQQRDTFRLSVDLMLHVAGADLRARDAPALIDAFCWCSVMRDLREDLAQGLYNVPADVAVAVREEGGDPSTLEGLLGSVAGKGWVASEYARARALLEVSARQLAALEGRPGLPLLRLFHRSIESFWARRLPRRHPFLREAAAFRIQGA